jgi:hypothetical protein
MSRPHVFIRLSTLVLLAWAWLGARADEPVLRSSHKYVLEYKFDAGETPYWEVSHRQKIRSTAGGSTQTVETASDSTKVWRVESVSPKGEITLVHQVDHVRMRHSTSGREETVVEIPSPDGKKPPLGYEQMADDVGVPLTRLVMDRHGNVIDRKDLRKKQRPALTAQDSPMTIPLPARPVAVGERWSNEYTVKAPRKHGGFKHVKLEQRFTLKEVSRDIATIAVDNTVLTPVNEPEVQAHVAQSKSKGTIKFDLVAGRVVHQDLSLDEEVIGVPLGEASSMHYVMRFTEKYLREPPQTARAKAKTKTR